MNRIEIDLFSDTTTRPTSAMRQAMAEAEVGDEQKREDPTVCRLEEMVAELTGKAGAVFLPSGTMCNLIAYAIHCRSGDEIIIESMSHPVHFEGGGPAAISGATLRGITTDRGIFSPDEMVKAVRHDDPHFPRTRLVSLENTHNMGGGTIWSLDQIKAVHDAARARTLSMHLDGARLMNAVVAAGYKTADVAQYFDSLWIDLTKGLGCPVGAALAGSADFVHQARRYKQMLGGAMRQAGIIASAGVYALNHHVERLAEDHAAAKKFAAGLQEIEGIRLDHGMPDTNIVMFDIAGTALTRDKFFAALSEYGIRMSPRLPPTAVRAVTHLDIPDNGIERTLQAVRKILKK